MAFSDYSRIPSENTEIGEGIFIGPNMFRNNVRQALQQLSADGRELYDLLGTGGGGGGGGDSSLRTDLNSPTGSTLVRTSASGTGATTRTVRDKLRDFVNVRDFGAVGDGINDDTAEIQAAINSLPGGGTVHFPPGDYRITATLTSASEGIVLAGAGQWRTRILQATTNTGVVALSGLFSGVHGLGMGYYGTPDANAVGVLLTGSYSQMSQFVIISAGIGVHLKDGVAFKLTNFDMLSYETNGVRVENLNDAFISKFIINAGSITKGTLGGIRMINKVEALNVTDGDILQGVFSMTSTAASFTVGSRPAYNKFLNVYFDSSTEGVVLDKCVEHDFVNCWFSNRPSHGIIVGEVDGVRFSGGGAINSGSNGVLVSANAKRVVFTNFAARGNSTTAANTFDGIQIAAGCTDFSVQGCTVGGAIGFGSQRFGVHVNSGAADRYIIADNLVTGNATAGVQDGGTGTNKRVANNY